MSAILLTRHCEAMWSPRQSRVVANRAGLLRYARHDDSTIPLESSFG